MSEQSHGGIQVISRAARILREVVARPDGLSLGQLAAATGLARSTVQRIVDALAAEHLLQAGAAGVRPGWGLRRLGELAGPSVARQLRPHLYRLYEETGETVDLSTLSGPEVLFLDRFLSDEHARAVPVIGMHYPAYAMANGKALLASLSNQDLQALYGGGALQRLTPGTVASVPALITQLKAIRAGGFAYDLEEHAPGLSAVGLPLPGHGPPPLAISVVLPAERFQKQRAVLERALRRCAQACQPAAG